MKLIDAPLPGELWCNRPRCRPDAQDMRIYSGGHRFQKRKFGGEQYRVEGLKENCGITDACRGELSIGKGLKGLLLNVQGQGTIKRLLSVGA